MQEAYKNATHAIYFPLAQSMLITCRSRNLYWQTARCKQIIPILFLQHWKKNISLCMTERRSLVCLLIELI